MFLQFFQAEHEYHKISLGKGNVRKQSVAIYCKSPFMVEVYFKTQVKMDEEFNNATMNIYTCNYNCCMKYTSPLRQMNV